MPPITFVAEFDPADLPTIVRQVVIRVGWSRWKLRIESLRLQEKSNPLWQHFLLEHYGLEMAFGRIHQHWQQTGRLPWPPRTAEEHRLYSFIATLSKVYPRLNAAGQRRLVGALHVGLEKEHGLGPLAFEMKTVAHLMARGAGLEFHDLEGNGGHDFVALIGSAEIEVECKHLSADLGRQIPRRSLYDFGGVLYPVMKRAVDSGNGGRFVRVTLPDRLTSNKEHQQNIMSRIDAVLTGKAAAIDDDVCIVSEGPFVLDNSPFSGSYGHNVTMDDVHRYLGQEFGIENANVLLNWRPGHAAVVVWFRSERPDKVLQRILENLKEDAKRQFSGTRPAVLCVHFSDLTEDQLLDLAKTEKAGTETGLQRMASILLHKRPHLHTLAITTDGSVQMIEKRSEDRKQTSVQEIGPSYVFRKSDHLMAGDASLRGLFV